MTPEEQKAAQEAEAAAQAAAATQTTVTVETKAATGSSIPDDPKALKVELERTRKEAASYRVKAREAAEAQRKAQEAALAEQGKHKELAETRGKALDEKEKELAELRTFKAEREQRETEERTKREAQVAADFAALPEDVRADVPDDPRAREVAVRTFQRATGKAPPPKAPATASVAPAPPKPAGGVKPPRPTEVEQQKYASTRDQKLKAELGAKIRAWTAWIQDHPEDS